MSVCENQEQSLVENNLLPQNATPISHTSEKMRQKMERGEIFERPRIKILDHVSAISLDEFWNKNNVEQFSTKSEK